MKDKKVVSKLINIKDVLTDSFVIPTYQRPYVWKDEQIKTLLNDVLFSFQQNMEEKYYVGTILTKNNENQVIELIDGQQRFTTIWLIAYCLQKRSVNTKLLEFLKLKGNLRLTFEIRTEIEQYLKLLLDGDDLKIDNSLKSRPFVEHISKGIATIEGFFQSGSLDLDLLKFGDYIYEKVYFINNVVPHNTDLNKLFTTINSSGKQLKQTDILKVKLLKKLTSEKKLYSKLWETVENTFDFFINNCETSFNKETFEDVDLRKYISFEDVIKIESAYCEIDTVKKEEGFTIADIINNERISSDINYYTPSNETDNEVKCRSIINFSQLLIHTYRIHLLKNGQEDIEGTFHIDRIIEIFNPLIESSERDVKKFLKLLWDVRQVFDLNILKWIKDEDKKVERLELVNFSKDYKANDYYTFDELFQLQSMLYFTGDYSRQYWLTPYLYFLLENREADKKSKLSYLEKIDDCMSLSNLIDMNVTWSLMKGENISKEVDIVNYLESSQGLKFRHYWFQKLEYILYKNWSDKGEPKFKKYRITSKNSVEHLNPQTPKNGTQLLDDNILNSFGNLVLLSVSQNSEYSNKYFDVKRSEFNNKEEYDTLKSYMAFNKENFEHKEVIKQHQEEMIKYFKDHYKLEE